MSALRLLMQYSQVNRKTARYPVHEPRQTLEIGRPIIPA